MNYRSFVRTELANQYAARGHQVRTDKRVNVQAQSTTAWNTADVHDVDTSYEDLEAAFWSETEDDEDMYACMF